MKRSNDKDYKRLAKMLAKWRKKTSTLLYRMGKEEGVRWDYLQRVEEAKGVTAVTLLAYLHYCHRHGYDPLSDLWPDEVPVTTVDSPTSKTVDGSANGSANDVGDDVVETQVSTPDSVKNEDEKEEHKAVCKTIDFMPEQQAETALNSDVKSPESDESQYNKLYHDNTSDNVPVETSDGTSESTSASTGDSTSIVEKTEAENEIETQLGKDSDAPSEPSQTASENFHDSFSDPSQIIPENNDNNPEVNISEDDEKQLATYNRAMDCFESKQPLDEGLQRAIISFGHQCPKCGKDVELKENGYIGHCAYVKECDYYAYGTLNNPIIIKKFKKYIVPIDLMGH